MRALRYSRIPSYVIFDERTRVSGPITSVGHGANRSYRWSTDNRVEIDRGWIANGKTPGELAQKLGVQESLLGATLAAYQESCRRGNDSELGRAPHTLVALQGDLFGLPVWPCLLNTQGGPKEIPAARSSTSGASRSNGSTAPASWVPSGDFSSKAAAISASVWAWGEWRVRMRRRRDPSRTIGEVPFDVESMNSCAFTSSAWRRDQCFAHHLH